MDSQTARRTELRALLGDLPDLDTTPTATVVAIEHYPGYEVHRLLLDLNGIEPVPACFVKPVDRERDRLPVVLYTHAHGGDLTIGKEELLRGRPELRTPPYAHALTRAGYAALCLDMWGFGERRGRSLDELFKVMIWHGQVLWGMMVYDSLRAVDYLASRSDVDTGRIAILGMSMGSTMAWWTAALDTRIAVCVDICCLTDYQALIRAGGLDRHGVYYYVPRLLTRFTTAGINALIAPRPHLGLAGRYDPLTPDDGLDVIDEQLRRVYAALDAPDAWRLSRYHCGHIETDGMRAEALAFLATWL
ncbi:dienelactone hydrolase family protein [Rugosimonospora africana]|uniref:Putative hydrolase YtaP n=1 Tax=Rugosimonospora africana TaxID=556532 RepID=A0A8J3QYN7_9ACTN|nr:dienelactone hydrolase family protein [Rugosimonospora africana]GIH18946.1 putative hydrolase YtaP [Rugosimonospora africana]